MVHETSWDGAGGFTLANHSTVGLAAAVTKNQLGVMESRRRKHRVRLILCRCQTQFPLAVFWR